MRVFLNWRLSLQQSLAPAIRFARDGRLRSAIAEERADLQRWPASASTYLPNGKPREPWGVTNVVTWDRRTNKLDAASDPRRPSGLGKVQ